MTHAIVFWEEARGYLRHGLSEAPKRGALSTSRWPIEMRAGKRDEAIKVLTDGAQGFLREAGGDRFYARRTVRRNWEQGGHRRRRGPTQETQARPHTHRIPARLFAHAPEAVA